jgi:hypothetical protein
MHPPPNENFFLIVNEEKSDKIKRRDIFLKCRQNYYISFLIDTHSKNETELYWRSEWGNDIKFSSQSSNTRGVAILFRNTFQNHIEKEIKDGDGNFIILSVRINDTLWKFFLHFKNMSRLVILSDESPLQLILPIFNNAIAVDILNTYQ